METTRSQSTNDPELGPLPPNRKRRRQRDRHATSNMPPENENAPTPTGRSNQGQDQEEDVYGDPEPIFEDVFDSVLEEDDIQSNDENEVIRATGEDTEDQYVNVDIEHLYEGEDYDTLPGQRIQGKYAGQKQSVDSKLDEVLKMLSTDDIHYDEITALLFERLRINPSERVFFIMGIPPNICYTTLTSAIQPNNDNATYKRRIVEITHEF